MTKKTVLISNVDYLCDIYLSLKVNQMTSCVYKSPMARTSEHINLGGRQEEKYRREQEQKKKERQ